jgi:hypothetical protein
MTTGSNIAAADYVAIQNKAESLLGTGSTTRGYGQTVQSVDVFTGNTITKAQWDALRFDIINIRLHQDGILPNIVQINVGDPIVFGAANPNTNYDTLLETATINRFQIANNQAVITSRGTATTSSAWSASATMTATVTFSNATDARYFFNSGGKIRIESTLTGGSSTAQVTAWRNILATVGTRSFGADTDPFVNYYTLTNSFQTYFQSSLSTPYSANNIRFEARTDVSNNSTGTATVLTLRVTLFDNYVDPGPDGPPFTGDEVDGTLSISISELKAFGNLLPSGSFSITSPSYSLSSITVA